ncbi:MAG: efflux RND transporter periplasmic adaptor subunit, partial [Candidatus Thorarchaeota archaeon]
KVGQQARISVDAYPRKYFLGQVSGVSPVVEGKSRTITVKIRVPNPQGLLLSGMFARGEISIKEINNAIMLPQDSVLNLGAMKVVPIVVPVKDKVDMGRVEIRKVTTGYSVKNRVHIMSGIEAGDLVIKETRVALRDGLEVKIVYE